MESGDTSLASFFTTTIAYEMSPARSLVEGVITPGRRVVARWVKTCTNLTAAAYEVDLKNTTLKGNTITGEYMTRGAVERERPSGSKAPRLCDYDEDEDVQGHFTLRRKVACPTAAQQSAARKILQAIYPSLQVPSGDLTPEVVIFAFEMLRRLDDTSRLTSALSELLSPIPYTSLSGLGEAMVNGVEVYLDDPGTFKKNPAALAMIKKFERRLRIHFNSAPTGGPCGERATSFMGF